MKFIKIIFYLAIISLAFYAGYLLKQQGTGFVLIQYQQFSIETSAFVFTLFLLALFAILYLLLRSFFNLIRLPGFISNSYQQYQNRKSSSGLVAGLIEFTEGRFKKAESLLVKQAGTNRAGVLNYLLAARAAQLLNADERRDNYLKQAYELSPDDTVSIAITQAELQLSRQQNEMALATLNQLLASNPKHAYAQRLMARAYQQLEDWEKLCPLLADLRRAKVLPEDDVKKTETIAYSGFLRVTGQNHNIDKLHDVWQSTPKYLRQQNEFITLYSSQLVANNRASEAENLLREKLNRQWSEQLIKPYCDALDHIDSAASEHLLNQLMDNVEKWLRNYPNHALLLLAAGKIATQLKLWGKAKNLIHSSLSLQTSADGCLQMAKLLEQTDERDEAQSYYRRGLEHCLKQ